MNGMLYHHKSSSFKTPSELLSPAEKFWLHIGNTSRRALESFYVTKAKSQEGDLQDILDMLTHENFELTDLLQTKNVKSNTVLEIEAALKGFGFIDKDSPNLASCHGIKFDCSC